MLLKKLLCCQILLLLCYSTYAIDFNSAKTYSLAQFFKEQIPKGINIKSLETIFYTEGGILKKETSNQKEIQSTLNYLLQFHVGPDEGLRCTDNSVVYVFLLENGKEVRVETECEAMILDGTYYSIINRKTMR